MRRSGGGREIAEVQVWMDRWMGQECRVLRRSGGGREVAELEVWMDGRVEGRVLRRSGGGREVAEVEVWMDGRMECVVLTRSRSKWRRQRGDGVEEEVNGGDGLHHQTAKDFPFNRCAEFCPVLYANFDFTRSPGPTHTLDTHAREPHVLGFRFRLFRLLATSKDCEHIS